MMGDFERKEAEKRNAERSKNNLEAYIISTGSVLENGAFDEVSLAALPHNATADGALHQLQQLCDELCRSAASVAPA